MHFSISFSSRKREGGRENEEEIIRGKIYYARKAYVENNYVEYNDGTFQNDIDKRLVINIKISLLHEEGLQFV